MYFDNFYAQVSVGTSSDTEFTMNTSLMPVQSGTVFVSYYNRNYESLEKLLSDKKYYTFSMHGNKAAMWNRNKMHYSLGYKKFYDETYYELDELVGLGLSDESFFRQSNDFITQINDMVKDSNEYEHYMGTLISLTNHTPFDDPIYTSGEDAFDIKYHTGKIDPTTKKEIVWDYLSRSDMSLLGRYIQSVHYADKCIGDLLNYINSNPAFDKTLFVFYGDHAAQISKNDFKHMLNFNPETGEDYTEEDPEYNEFDYYDFEVFKKVPLIMFTKDKKLKGTYSYPMGMIDVLPTISNMLGIEPKYALGNDIFNIKDKNTVVFPNGNFLTKDVYYYDSQSDYRVLTTAATLDKDYIEERRKKTTNILNVSNDIIVYDLIDKLEKVDDKNE
jgi:phosphoglycerol transferase MdoB-like AlkP superfamily enzyme